MKRLVHLMLLTVVPLLIPTGASAASHVTFTSPDCVHLHVRPTRILFACADGNYYASHLTWESWRVKEAVGEGLFHQNDCRPNCAHGTFHNRRGRIVLGGRVWCASLHKHMFRHASVTYRKSLLGRLDESFRLLLPC